MKKIFYFFISKLFVSIFLLITVSFLFWIHFIKTNIVSTLNLFLQVFGGFVATLFGVYISLTLTNKEESRKEDIESKIYLNESLKIILNEIAFNNQMLTLALKMLDKKSTKAFLILDDFNDALFPIKNTKDRAYYTLIGSNKFIHISKDLDLLNILSASYDNTKITINQVGMGRNILKNYKLKKDDKKELEYFVNILDMSLAQIKGQIKINKKAIKKIKSILKSSNIYYKSTYTNYRNK